MSTLADTHHYTTVVTFKVGVLNYCPTSQWKWCHYVFCKCRETLHGFEMCATLTDSLSLSRDFNKPH